MLLHFTNSCVLIIIGQVDLSGVGKRGQRNSSSKLRESVLNYSINMTVLPDTVVKIYIVTYNFSDMPQTFLRQKTLSRPHHLVGQGVTPTTYLPAFHYLIHLRQVDIKVVNSDDCVLAAAGLSKL